MATKTKTFSQRSLLIEKKSFNSQVSETMILSKHIFRILSGHQLLFK